MFLGVTWLLLEGSPLQPDLPKLSLSKLSVPELSIPGQLTQRLAGLRQRLFNSGTSHFGSSNWVSRPLPLEMPDGDPHIRALMRTISASESNTDNPYALLYGGKTIKDLSRHPEQCITIVNGPNQGNCSTAAGRYQMINTTWYQESAKYHPVSPPNYAFWRSYDFSPVYQDQVVHDWLSDSSVWGLDIAATLAAGDINTVLKRLSGTWTSLGYGIETNSMSSQLPNIYQEMLAEELAARDDGNVQLD
ncbi:MAG: glycoside hydrolase family protein [Cyanobacteria bacterium P01_A01_bin.105]